MATQFKEQGGAATMDPSRFRRWATSKMMTVMSSEQRLLKTRRKLELERSRKGAPHRVEYFHQVDDAYSALAAQVLSKLQKRYNVDLVCHLVGGPTGDNSPEPELLLNLARYDSFHVAPYYQLRFPEHQEPLPQEPETLARSVLANLDDAQFVEHAGEICLAMWEGRVDDLQAVAKSLGVGDASLVDQRLATGNQRRAELKHYSGAMFYYGGEWYWGVDRLYHLEQRLIELGLDSMPGEPLIAARPEIVTGPQKNNASLTLEIYPSLRSPYTAVIFNKTLEFAEQVGIELKIRPVLPMVMRGVPATREKGMYILFDAGREARALGQQFGPCADPIGEPARRAYSLYPWAEQQGKGAEFFSAFLNCAWVDAINTNTDRGMQTVVENAGLNWDEARKIIGQPGWEKMLEENRLAMYEMGIWGVPAYRLLSDSGESLLEVWGQDRLWMIAHEIQKQLRDD